MTQFLEQNMQLSAQLFHTFSKTDPGVIKNVMLNTAEHEIFPAYNC